MSKNILVSRHSGAIEWFLQQGISIHEINGHLVIDDLDEGDRVYGVLPIQLIAKINSIGVDYFHIVINPTQDVRGREWTADQLNNMQVYLQCFSAKAHEKIEP